MGVELAMMKSLVWFGLVGFGLVGLNAGDVRVWFGWQ
jgi:hypothetical protein